MVYFIRFICLSSDFDDRAAKISPTSYDAAKLCNTNSHGILEPDLNYTCNKSLGFLISFAHAWPCWSGVVLQGITVCGSPR